MSTKPFIYDAAQEVRRTAEKTSGGFDNAMNQYVQARQQSYDFIKNQVDNIEKIKQEATRFNRDIVYKAADDLESQVIGLLKSNKNIDLGKVGGVSNGIESLRYATQQGKEIPEVIESYAKVIKDSAKFMNNPALAYTQVMTAATDPEFMFSPNSLTAKAQSIVNSHIDPQRYINETIYELFNQKDVPFTTVTIRRDNGSYEAVSYKPNPYLVFNPQTNNMDPVMVKRDDGTMIRKIDADIASLVPDNMMSIIKERSGAANAMENFSPLSQASDMVLEALRSYSGVKVETKRYKEQVTRDLKAIEVAGQNIAASKARVNNDAQRLSLAKQTTANTLSTGALSRKVMQARLDGTLPGSEKESTIAVDADGTFNVEIGDDLGYPSITSYKRNFNNGTAVVEKGGKLVTIGKKESDAIWNKFSEAERKAITAVAKQKVNNPPPPKPGGGKPNQKFDPNNPI